MVRCAVLGALPWIVVGHIGLHNAAWAPVLALSLPQAGIAAILSVAQGWLAITVVGAPARG